MFFSETISYTACKVLRGSQSLLLVSGDELTTPQSGFKISYGCCQGSCLSTFDLAEPMQRSPQVLVLMPRLQLSVASLSWPTPIPVQERGAERANLALPSPTSFGWSWEWDLFDVSHVSAEPYLVVLQEEGYYLTWETSSVFCSLFHPSFWSSAELCEGLSCLGFS